MKTYKEDDALPGMGIFSWFSYQLPVRERLRLIKDAGFSATALWWGDEASDADDKDSQPSIARGLGLDIDYVHAADKAPNDLWIDGISGEEYLNSLMACICDCSRHDIPTAVMHITRLSSRPPVTAIGLERIKRLVDIAETKQVNIAIENMGSIQHLDYVFSNIRSQRLGFCYDSGHEYHNHLKAHCLSRYGDRLFAVHIDDNFGDDDTHLLPFDGAVDWPCVMRDLSKCKEPGNLMLEVDFNRDHDKSAIYKGLSAADFLAAAYARLGKLIALL